MDTIQQNNAPIILFDGVCNLCNGFVNLLIRIDKKAALRFMPLQSGKIEKITVLTPVMNDLPINLSTVILVEGEKISLKSNAVLRTAAYLPWPWKVLKYFSFLPNKMRDSIYDFIAKHRYRWFGKSNQCMIPTPDVQKRFL